MISNTQVSNLIQLSDRIRSLSPNAVGASLVGSSAEPRSIPPADIDLILFDYNIPLGEEVHIRDQFDNSFVQGVSYHPHHFSAVLQDDELTFISLRELRKLLRGIILFDTDSALANLVSKISQIQVPFAWVKPFLRRSLLKNDPLNPLSSRLDFYIEIEKLAFAWLQSELHFRYSKPKWLLQDSGSLPTPSLHDLLTSVAKELLDSKEIKSIAESLSAHMHNNVSMKDAPSAYFHLKDTEHLLAHSLTIDSVFPLRMALYQYSAALAKKHGLPYQDIRSIALLQTLDASYSHICEDLLLFNSIVPELQILLFNRSTTELLNYWDEKSSRANAEAAKSHGLAQTEHA